MVNVEDELIKIDQIVTQNKKQILNVKKYLTNQKKPMVTTTIF